MDLQEILKDLEYLKVIVARVEKIVKYLTPPSTGYQPPPTPRPTIESGCECPRLDEPSNCECNACEARRRTKESARTKPASIRSIEKERDLARQRRELEKQLYIAKYNLGDPSAS